MAVAIIHLEFSAKITATGSDSFVPDNPSAVDADVFVGRKLVGAVTLVPDHTGDLSGFGSDPSLWQDSQLMAWISNVSCGDGNKIDVVERAIVSAVRASYRDMQAMQLI